MISHNRSTIGSFLSMVLMTLVIVGLYGASASTTWVVARVCRNVEDGAGHKESCAEEARMKQTLAK